MLMVPILFTTLDNTGFIVRFLGSHRVLHCSNMSLGTVHIENQLLPHTSPYTLHPPGSRMTGGFSGCCY